MSAAVFVIHGKQEHCIIPVNHRIESIQLIVPKSEVYLVK